MNNTEIVELVNKILHPYYEFNLEDIYGDRGSCIIPNVNDVNELYFKRKSRDHKYRILSLCKKNENELVNKVKELNVGDVDTFNIMAIGKFIRIIPYRD